MKRVILFVLALVLVLSFVSCAFFDPLNAKDKVFSNDSFSISLTEGFFVDSIEGYDFVFDSAKIAVFGFAEAKTLFSEEKDMSLTKYAEFVRIGNADKQPTDVTTENGLYFIEYSFYNETQKIDYSYFTAFFEDKDSYWVFQFSCAKSLYEECKPSFIKWAKTVQFTNV